MTSAMLVFHISPESRLQISRFVCSDRLRHIVLRLVHVAAVHVPFLLNGRRPEPQCLEELFMNLRVLVKVE